MAEKLSKGVQFSGKTYLAQPVVISKCFLYRGLIQLYLETINESNEQAAKLKSWVPTQSSGHHYFDNNIHSTFVSEGSR